MEFIGIILKTFNCFRKLFGKNISSRISWKYIGNTFLWKLETSRWVAPLEETSRFCPNIWTRRNPLGVQPGEFLHGTSKFQCDWWRVNFIWFSIKLKYVLGNKRVLQFKYIIFSSVSGEIRFFFLVWT